MKTAAKQQLLEQTVRELGGELYNAFFQGIEEQQELTPEQSSKLMEYLGGEIERRDELAVFIRRWEGEATLLRAEEKRLAQRRHSIDGFIRGLREFIALQLEAWHDEKGQPAILKRVVGKVYRFILKEGKPRVEIENERLVPDEFCQYSRTIDKESVAAALASGREVPGARLVPGRSFVEIR